MHRIHHTDFSRWMQERGITASDIASAIGVGRATVYAWAAGRWSPRLKQMRALERYSSGELTLEMFAPLPATEATDADTPA
jgi:transcriptional regulator with XRE-family HTH domain